MFGNSVDRAVVVFRYFVGRDERIDGKRVNLKTAYFGREPIDHRRCYHGGISTHGSDDERFFAVDEKAPLQVRMVEPVVEQDRGNAPVDLIARVFEVPIPDIQRARRCPFEQVASAHHANGFDKLKTGLA